MTGLVKLALKRDPSVPVGQPATLHVDCPCGRELPISLAGQYNECHCGLVVDDSGWIKRRPL